MLSWEFSHDTAAEGGAGGKSEIRIDELVIQEYGCLMDAVSLRVFLVQQIAMVTHQEKRLGGFRNLCSGLG